MGCEDLKPSWEKRASGLEHADQETSSESPKLSLHEAIELAKEGRGTSYECAS